SPSLLLRALVAHRRLRRSLGLVAALLRHRCSSQCSVPGLAPDGLPRVLRRAPDGQASTAKNTALHPGRAVLAMRPLAFEAVRAVHGPVAPRLEGHLGLPAALGTHRRIHVASLAAVSATRAPGAAALGLAGRSAFGAAGRLVVEAAAGVKLLLASGKGELAATITADQRLVYHVALTPRVIERTSRQRDREEEDSPPWAGCRFVPLGESVAEPERSRSLEAP